jgi:hypothetical protein
MRIDSPTIDDFSNAQHTHTSSQITDLETTLGTLIIPAPKVSGRLYTGLEYLGQSAGSAIATGTVFLMKMTEWENTTYDRIYINITGAGTNVRLGVWNYDTGALLSDSGNISASGTTDVFYTFASPLVTTRGQRLWLGVTCDANVSVRFHSVLAQLKDQGSTNANTGTILRAQYSFTYGALANLPALSTSSNGAPAIYLRKQ